jgi:hypothetical protein
VPGDEKVAIWIADKLQSEGEFSAVTSTGSGFLDITRKGQDSFVAAAIGVRDVVTPGHVIPLFEVKKPPEFVVNIPSKAIWSGQAIEVIHAAPAAFGTFGELLRAAREDFVSTYRNKEYSFFERAFRQHTAVRDITRLYDRVFQLHRHRRLKDITIVLVDAYDMSAEDVRNARDQYGSFDVALKISSYGSITSAADEAARHFGAEALTLKALN